MRKLGVLKMKNDGHTMVTDYLTNEHIAFSLINRPQREQSLDGLIVPLQTRNELYGVVKPMVAVQEQSASFIWVFSTEELTSERELLLELGVNDVVTTSEGLPDLTKIISNTFKRLDKREELQSKRTASDFSINPISRECTIQGKTIHLATREYQVLTYLNDHLNEVIPYQELGEYLWSDKKKNYSFDVANIVHHLRGKLAFQSSCRIETIRSVGYTLRR